MVTKLDRRLIVLEGNCTIIIKKENHYRYVEQIQSCLTGRSQHKNWLQPSGHSSAESS